LPERFVIFGNSGAGKSTLARQLVRERSLAHLDLDTLAWQPHPPPTRRPLAESLADIDRFTAENEGWVAEGAYASLIEPLLPRCTELIFMNPGVETCVRNCRARPWEPHKYTSREEQERNLAMLVDWVRAYETRNDEFSLQSHRRLYNSFAGKKREIATIVQQTPLQVS
jgi:adenylate kinase family enzyme